MNTLTEAELTAVVGANDPVASWPAATYAPPPLTWPLSGIVGDRDKLAPRVISS